MLEQRQEVHSESTDKLRMQFMDLLPLLNIKPATPVTIPLA